MTPVILLGLVIGLPLLVSVLLRVKPIHLFVAIMAGYALATFLGDSAELTFQAMVHVANPGVVIRIGLLLLPVVLTWYFMRKTLPAAALPFQFVLLVADSLLIATFLVPLLTGGVQADIYRSNFGDIFRQAHDIIIAGVASLHVLVMWATRPRHHDEHGHHGKKHKKHLL